MLLTMFVAPNELIWKHELNARIDLKNRLECGSVPISKAFNGSGGASIAGSCTFPDAQHIPAVSFLDLRALQCGHSLSMAPITTFE